jgi:hypothetical protein
MIDNLPPIHNLVIVHYGCPNFKKNTNVVSWIGAVYYNPNKTYFFEINNEIEILEKFNQFIENFKSKTFVHWGMNRPDFGFRVLKERYFELTNKEINMSPLKEIDFSEYLKTKYTVDYVDRKGGRLNHLAELNNFSGKMNQIEVIKRSDASNRLELVFSIVQAEIQGKLKTLTSDINNSNSFKEELHNNIFKGSYFRLFEKYYNDKSMSSQSRTDFRFLFEQMKKDNLIYDTVTLSQYIKFIQKNFDYIDNQLKAINLDTIKNIQRRNDYEQYKDNL